MRNLGIDRNEIVFALELHAVTAEIDERDRIRAGGCGFLEKIAEGAAQRILIEIARADHIEAGSLQRLCDQACIVGRRRKGCGLVACIADQEGNAFFSPRGTRYEGKHEWNERNQHQLADRRHDIPQANHNCAMALDCAGAEWDLNRRGQ
jgi:hypothetical protein